MKWNPIFLKDNCDKYLIPMLAALEDIDPSISFPGSLPGIGEVGREDENLSP